MLRALFRMLILAKECQEDGDEKNKTKHNVLTNCWNDDLCMLPPCAVSIGKRMKKQIYFYFYRSCKTFSYVKSRLSSLFKHGGT